MSGGSSLPYGNIKNGFVLSCAPTGPTVGTTSIYISSVTLATVGGISGAVITLNVPGTLLGDFVDVTRPSNIVNGATLAYPYVSISNAYVYAAGNVSVVLANTSIGTFVTTPIENYAVLVMRPDTPNAPTTTPTGFY
jgi:hypothetical protein